MLRLLCVTAHPDDEAASFGGSLHLYHGRGVETSVLCLTPGQAARNRGSAKNDGELAEIRRKEFTGACAILKVSQAKILDYPDGQLHRQDLYRIACDVTLHVRQFRPQVVVTFGPEGGLTGHTDHSMASLAATLAFQWAARNNRYPDQLHDVIAVHQAQKLYYATANFTLPDRQPVTLSPPTTIIDIAAHFEKKIEAFKAHQTQAPLWPLFESHIRPRGRNEMFHLAAWVKSETVSQESDLFAGILDNR